MKIHHLKPAPGAHRAKTRKGRGEAAGKGKTAGRGTKGSGARRNMPAGFEGGQMPLQRRLPKLPGFTPRNRVTYATVNVGRIEAAFDDGDEVTPDALRAKGLVRRGDAPVKILGNGDLGKSLTVAAHAFSGSAREKVTGSGGTVRELPRRPATGDRAGS
ncbi:MAG: 50S ribosomal protein L15 [Euzebyales bacterium]|nr:50S ribosomal protein L15 [Euzebyales bacterium]MBA3621484.1 50S ribosomal protein L15 [Euzebyales bacterium]